ncbi:MAG: DUF3052 family protein [Cyclobacteriaceae bacterium]|nr:DUF3052 family protein [Cyclobacteriaceae bacterium]
MIISFVQAPENLFRIPGDLPEDIHVEEIGSGRLKDYIHGFYTMEKDLARDIYFLKSQLKKDGMIWISWPKGGSSVITNLNREKVREEVLKEGLVDVKVCSVDQTWSALKFVYRLKNRG